MMNIRPITALAFLLFAPCTLAAISGPTTSTGTFTLTWSGSNELTDVSSGRIYRTGSQSFTKNPGTYRFEEKVCVNLPTIANPRRCYTVDTHSVTVSSTATTTTAATTPAASSLVVRHGDYDNDGDQDLAVISQNSTTRQISDFIIRNLGNGNVEVVTNATSGQISAARRWPAVSGAVAITSDMNLDNRFDVLIRGLGNTIPGASRVLVWSENETHNYPTAAKALNSESMEFLRETVASLGNPTHFNDALVRECRRGWRLKWIFYYRPTWYFDSDGHLRFAIIGGFYLVRILVTECITTYDPSRIDSVDALIVFRNMMYLNELPREGDDLRISAEILYNILVSRIGFTGLAAPPKGSTATVISNTARKLLFAIRFTTIVALSLFLIEEVLDFVLPILLSCGRDDSNYDTYEVANGTNYRITPAQRSSAQRLTDRDRELFWRSRYRSKDPLAPVAVDIVTDAYRYGCFANRWVPHVARRSVNLTDIGVKIMQKHVEAVDQDTIGILGKLSAREIARYHHDVFRSLDISTRAFGGTPLTGYEWEVYTTRQLWCPSCE